MAFTSWRVCAGLLLRAVGLIALYQLHKLSHAFPHALSRSTSPEVRSRPVRVLGIKRGLQAVMVLLGCFVSGSVMGVASALVFAAEAQVQAWPGSSDSQQSFNRLANLRGFRPAGAYGAVEASVPLFSTIDEQVAARIRGFPFVGSFENHLAISPTLAVEAGWNDPATGLAAGVRALYAPYSASGKAKPAKGPETLLTQAVERFTLASPVNRSREAIAVFVTARGQFRIYDGRRFYAEVGIGPVSTRYRSQGYSATHNGTGFLFGAGFDLVETRNFNISTGTSVYVFNTDFDGAVEGIQARVSARATVATFGVRVTFSP